MKLFKPTNAVISLTDEEMDFLYELYDFLEEKVINDDDAIVSILQRICDYRKYKDRGNLVLHPDDVDGLATTLIIEREK